LGKRRHTKWKPRNTNLSSSPAYSLLIILLIKFFNWKSPFSSKFHYPIVSGTFFNSSFLFSSIKDFVFFHLFPCFNVWKKKSLRSMIFFFRIYPCVNHWSNYFRIVRKSLANKTWKKQYSGNFFILSILGKRNFDFCII
jgi:hypothetical protein